MKTNEEFKSMSAEELTEKRIKLKKTILILGFIMGIAILFLIFTVIKTKNYAFLAIGIGASFGLLPGIIQLKNIDNEIKGRN
jgi:ethanolamine transporter EutH